MTEGEIVRSYKDAKDKNKQISILKDLNGCSTYDICQVLIKNGVEIANPPKKRGRKPASKNAEAEVKANMSKEEVSTNGSGEQGDKIEKNITTPMPSAETHEDTKVKADVIPNAVRRICEQRIETLTGEIMAIEKEVEEIQRFLVGA